MTNPRGKLFATASFCAHAAPVIAGAYRPLHAGKKGSRRGGVSRGRGKIIFELHGETDAEKWNLRPRLLVTGPLADALRVLRLTEIARI